MEPCEKKALIECAHQRLPELSRNYTQFGRPVVSESFVEVVSTGSTTKQKPDPEPVEVPAGGKMKEETRLNALITENLRKMKTNG